MKYEFKRQEPCYDKVLFVLTLDKKKMKERILIGEEYEIRSRLDGRKDSNVICDVTRPLGSFLIHFEHDEDGDWNLNGLMPLHDALNTNRWKQPVLEQQSSNFLSEKFLSGEPVKMYVAFRIWNEYLQARLPADRKSACERFMNKMSKFTMGFRTNAPLQFDEETGIPRNLNLSHRFFSRIPNEETRLELWYPDKKRTTECVVAYDTFSPLIIYYLNRLQDWGLCFRKCKICGNIFLAKSQRYELCSDQCRKAQALQNKRDFDERARENNYDLLYKNECQNWRNKINKQKKKSDFPEERMEEINTAFDKFKKEALQRKNLVKTGKASPKEFTDWLYAQSTIIFKLCE